jgi:hypothetical protein
MIEEKTDAQTPVEQGPADPRTAEGAGESANAEAVPAVAQESPIQAESVAAAEELELSPVQTQIHSESYAEMQARVEGERLIRPGSESPQDGCRFHASAERKAFDLTATAKELGFPNVVIRHAADRIGKLDYLDNALAIVTYEDGSTLSVQPCQIEIVPAKADEDSGQ